MPSVMHQRLACPITIGNHEISIGYPASYRNLEQHVSGSIHRYGDGSMLLVLA
jgi:hypothetical protein